MKSIHKTLLFCILAALLSCKKKDKADDVPVVAPPAQTGSTLKIKFDHMVDSLPLIFNTNYLNAKGDTFSVSKFNYFISNIVLTDVNGNTCAEPNSYHLVRHSDQNTTTITLNNVPENLYKSISLMLGVDSAKNVSGAQGGDLSLEKSGDMFWDWSTGYIFYKLEGASPRSGDTQKHLTYHIGGYAGANKGQRIMNISFGNTFPNVEKGGTPVLHLKVNVNEIFKTPTVVDVSAPGFFDHTTVDATNKILADNYADMMSFGSVQ